MSNLLDTATSGPRPLNTCHRFSFSFQTPDNYVHSTLSIPLKGDPLSFEPKPFDTSDVISTLERSSVRSWSRYTIYQVMETSAIFAAEGDHLVTICHCQFSPAQPPGDRLVRWQHVVISADIETRNHWTMGTLDTDTGT